MLITTNELRGKPVLALDGNLGRVEDFLFDDKNWVIRYMVTKTGRWLSNRLVLLSPHVLINLDAKADVVRVRLHKRQIEASPPLELHFPVSRRYEVEHYRYFGLPEYWTGSALWGRSGYPLVSPPRGDKEDFKLHYHRADKHLQSSNSISGFKIQASDGPAGDVTGFWINDSTWEVRDMVAKAGHWYASREVLIAVASIERIGYEESTVYVTLSREDIQWTAEKGRTKVQPRASASGFTQE
jgi:hypothetical protein